MFTVANKLNELRDACKNAGIKATGKKPELIERLNYNAVIRAEVEAAETLLAAEAAEKLLASDADEEDEDAIVQITINRTAGEEVDPGEEDNDGAEEDELVANGNGKRVRPVYIQDKVYGSDEEAERSLRAEDLWNMRTVKETEEGKKRWWICNKCTKKGYILYHKHDNSVSIWSSHSIEHNHVASDDKRRYGLNDVTKAEIATLYKAGVRKASRLLTALRNKKEKFLPKKMIGTKILSFSFLWISDKIQNMFLF